MAGHDEGEGAGPEAVSQPTGDGIHFGTDFFQFFEGINQHRNGQAGGAVLDAVEVFDPFFLEGEHAQAIDGVCGESDSAILQEEEEGSNEGTMFLSREDFGNHVKVFGWIRGGGDQPGHA